MQRNLARGFYEEAKETARRYQSCFGEGNFFLELQDHGLAQQQLVNQQLLRLSKDTGIELVATNDVHYTYQEDETPHDILLCLQTGKKLSDENRMRYEGGQYYVKSEEEMKKLFPYAMEAVENTQKIADRCQVEIEFGVTKLPDFPVPDGFTTYGYLEKLCYDGLKDRYPVLTQELKDRLEYELKVIRDMGYVEYFLIVWDYIRFAREQGISVGPGRGSAAGSIVSYSIGITNIDPIRYNLIFERFLNPERVSMPDIDVDFCFERRQEVIDYVIKKYGKECVTLIITFGTLAARGVIRDVGRVMDMPYAFVDSIAKNVPNELGITIEKALKMNPELRGLYENDESVRQLIDMSKRLEGLPRHSSTHAAGVVISQKPMEEYVPLARGIDGMITTQFTMTTIEELGLLKMDFLGLRTLTVLKNTADLVEKNHSVKMDIDRISFDDKRVLESLGTGRTEGVFQLESAGMRNFMKELKPQNLEDIIAGIALYRPGPMDFIPSYIRGKNSAGQIVYDCPQLEPILSPTYGCIVYQEQVMQIVRDLAGYTLGRSDLVRRAMSKKKQSVMEQERKNFVYGNPEENVPGCIANGIDEKVANKIYDEMIDFAKYAFNKSHAAAYAVIAYQTAYLKYYYPLEYMASLMTSVQDHVVKVSEYILTCRRLGIEILSPDINEGEGRFSVSNNSIRYGISAIKSVGRPVIEGIIEEREAGGPFTSITDFLKRMGGKEMNKRAVENLIKAGACDCLPGCRQQKMLVFGKIMDGIHQEKRHSMAGQMSLFDFVSKEERKDYEISLPNVGEYDKETLLGFEKEVLGVYISGHPLEEYESRWRKNITAVTSDFLLDEETNETKVKDGETVLVGGMITEKTIKYTKTNQQMAFLTIEDLVGTVEAVVFPRDYERNQALIQPEAKVFIRGRANVEEEKNGKVICEKVYSFDDVKRELWIQFADKEAFETQEETLYGVIADSDGADAIVVYLADRKAMKRLPASKNVEITSALIQTLADAFGKNNIKVVEKAIENRR